MSDSLTLAVPCSSGIRFFMKFRGRNAHPNRPGGLSHLRSPPLRVTALNQRAGIIFAKQFHIVVGQCAHQFQMEIIHHAGTGSEEILAE
jgi:hypothetical protein